MGIWLRSRYKLYLLLLSNRTGSFPDVSVSPTSIDFGLIDTGHPSATHTIVLKNDGNALTRFYIDTTTSSGYTVIVEPIKGMLQVTLTRYFNFHSLIAYSFPVYLIPGTVIAHPHCPTPSSRRRKCNY